MTDSEPLSLEQEYEMQEKWMNDIDSKLFSYQLMWKKLHSLSWIETLSRT